MRGVAFWGSCSTVGFRTKQPLCGEKQVPRRTLTVESHTYDCVAGTMGASILWSAVEAHGMCVEVYLLAELACGQHPCSVLVISAMSWWLFSCCVQGVACVDGSWTGCPPAPEAFEPEGQAAACVGVMQRQQSCLLQSLHCLL
jgi:hypothetical protein